MNDNSFLPVGTQLKRGTYKILSKIDHGGFGVVYKAQNMETGQVVAVKEFFSHEYHTRDSKTFSVKSRRGYGTAIREEKDKFNREVDKIREFDHYNIIQAYESFKENNTVYYAMEYIEGCSLSAYCEKRGRKIREEEALDIVRQIADALKTMHNAQYNHADVKPKNILIDEVKRRAVLIDFGTAHKYLGDGSIRPAEETMVSRVESPGYTSRVLAAYPRLLPSRDIYSLGATLYNIITGRDPLGGINIEPNDMSQRTEYAIKKAMTESIDEVLQNIDDFLKLLPQNNEELSREISHRVTPRSVKELRENQVFVFGSNIAGHHSGAAAKQALLKWGAVWGLASGPQGRSYAIPTVTGKANNVKLIEPYARQFAQYARDHRDKTFLVTAVGCGNAGFTAEQVAPFFRDCIDLPNVYLPKDFWRVLRNKGFVEPRVQVSRHS